MITVKNISKKYGDFSALKEVSFQVKKGEILCLLGANGAGKSTTINILLNFTRATSGIAEINAYNVLEAPIKTKEFLTYIPENLMLYPTFNAVENLDYFTKLSGKKFNTNELKSILSEAGFFRGSTSKKYPNVLQRNATKGRNSLSHCKGIESIVIGRTHLWLRSKIQ